MGQPDTQHATLIHQPHAAHRLNSVVVAGPDKHVVVSKSLGQSIGVMAVQRE